MRFLLSLILICTFTAACTSPQAPADDEAGVTAAVKAFQTAMDTGDPAGVMQYIHDDALMIEGGNIETRMQYEAAHLPADIAFSKEVTAKRMPIRLTVRGDTAWVLTSTDFTGTFEGSPIDFLGLESMTLSREPAGWRIRLIHWSSQNRL